MYHVQIKNDIFSIHSFWGSPLKIGKEKISAARYAKPRMATGATTRRSDSCDSLVTETVLSVMTCSACGNVASSPLVCDNCGAIACSKHAGEACLVCGKGTWAVRCRCLSDTLEQLLLLQQQQQQCFSPKPRDVTSPNRVSQLTVEVEGMAKYCLDKHGEGEMSIYVDLIPPDEVVAMGSRLNADGVETRYDGVTGMLHVRCVASRLVNILGVPPEHYGLRVQFRKTGCTAKL
jgi:hypothetical protein